MRLFSIICALFLATASANADTLVLAGGRLSLTSNRLRTTGSLQRHASRAVRSRTKQDALVPPTEMLRIAVDGLKPVLR
jgi:hypothetical protein